MHPQLTDSPFARTEHHSNLGAPTEVVVELVDEVVDVVCTDVVVVGVDVVVVGFIVVVVAAIEEVVVEAGLEVVVVVFRLDVVVEVVFEFDGLFDGELGSVGDFFLQLK